MVVIEDVSFETINFRYPYHAAVVRTSQKVPTYRHAQTMLNKSLGESLG